MVSAMRTPIAMDVVVRAGVGDVALAVCRHTQAAISCWWCDAKHRKHHLHSVSFSNHERLKLHMCMYEGAS